jgi:hypothetical protein
MADEQTEAEEAENEAGEEEAEEQESSGPKIMCFVSKDMVPTSETVEIEYSSGKTVRVLPKYIKYDRDEEATA